MSRAGKGASFERETCKRFSLWWSDGADDGIFWRSSQSGGRATQRAKKGKNTFGSHGDILALDPVGQPLLDLFTIELKRGNSHGTPGDLFDRMPTDKQRPFEACLWQAHDASVRAKTKTWLLICRCDHRQAVVYFPVSDWFHPKYFHGLTEAPCARWTLGVNTADNDCKVMNIYAIHLDRFFAVVKPEFVHNILRAGPLRGSR